MLRLSRIAAAAATGAALLALGASPALAATAAKPTSLTLHASRTTVPHNQKVTLTELLKVGSKGLAGEPVKLEKRAAGARSFTLVSTKTTNAKGQVTLSVIPGTRKGQKEQYELIFAGNKTDKGSHSRIITITVS